MAITQSDFTFIEDTMGTQGEPYFYNDKRFREFCEEHREKLVWFVCREFQLPVEDAEDVVVMALEKAWSKRRSCKAKTRAKATSWIYAIVRNEARDFIRKHKDVLSRMGELPDNISTDVYIDDLLHQNELRELLNQAIHQLSEQQQLVIDLFVICGFDAREVAECLGTSRDNVYQIKKRALEKLEVILVELGWEG